MGSQDSIEEEAVRMRIDTHLTNVLEAMSSGVVEREKREKEEKRRSTIERNESMRSQVSQASRSEVALGSVKKSILNHCTKILSFS